jgi:hypothetical protein
MIDRNRPLPIVGESAPEYRERMARARAEALERRQQQIDEQRSPLHFPAARIQIWERLHQLDLPRKPGHRLLEVIATDTGLSLEEVRAEQVSRAAGGLS